MIKKFHLGTHGIILCSLICFSFFVLSFCGPGRLTIVTDSPGLHTHIKLKFSLKNAEKKQSGKIVMKFDRYKTKILFLSPLNQINFKLFVEKGDALLINTKKKKYWKGDFHDLIVEMWDIDLKLDELKDLIREGIVPERKIKKHDLEFDIKNDNKTGKPKNIKIYNSEIVLNLKIQKRKIKNGHIQFYVDFSKLKESSIKNVLSDE